LLANRMSVTEAAEIGGCARSHLAEVLNGRERGSPMLWSRIARIVGMRVEDLHRDGWAR
jgi:hypothetical protein